MKKLLLASLVALSFSVPAFASSDIALDNLTAGPGESKDLNLDKLTKNVNYAVSCIAVTNSGIEAYYPVKVLFGDNQYNGTITLNGEPVADQVVKLPGDHSTTGSNLVINSINTAERNKITFVNLDHQATVDFYNCVAQVQVDS